MRSVLIALVLVCLIPMAAFAQGGTPSGTTTPSPDIVRMTVLMPVIANKATLSSFSSGGANLPIMVPVTVDASTLSSLSSNKNVSVMMVPFVTPLMMPSKLPDAAAEIKASNRMIMPTMMDKTMVSDLMNGKNTILMAMMPPMAMDSALTAKLTSSSSASLDQPTIDKMLSGDCLLMLMPMMTTNSISAATPLAPQQISNLSSGKMTAMVPMMMSDDALTKLSQNTMLVMPMTAPVALPDVINCPIKPTPAKTTPAK